jgi:hypothetical protein
MLRWFATSEKVQPNHCHNAQPCAAKCFSARRQLHAVKIVRAAIPVKNSRDLGLAGFMKIG